MQPDGSVKAVRVVEPLDTAYGLDGQALVAAARYRFTPGTLDGKPVPVLVPLPVTFR